MPEAAEGARKGNGEEKEQQWGKKFDYRPRSDQHRCVSRLFAPILFSPPPPPPPSSSFWRAFHAANFNEIRTEVCIIGSRGRGACSRPLCLARRDCHRWNFYARLATRTCVSVAFYTWTAIRSFSPREFPRCSSPRFFSPSFLLPPRSRHAAVFLLRTNVS